MNTNVSEPAPLLRERSPSTRRSRGRRASSSDAEHEQRVERHHDRGDALDEPVAPGRSARRRRCACGVTIAAPPTDRASATSAQRRARRALERRAGSSSMPDVQVEQQVADARRRSDADTPTRARRARASRAAMRQRLAFIAAYASGDARLAGRPHSSSGMPTRNSSAPLTRCRIETIAGNGSRIASRLR